MIVFWESIEVYVQEELIELEKTGFLFANFDVLDTLLCADWAV